MGAGLGGEAGSARGRWAVTVLTACVFVAGVVAAGTERSDDEIVGAIGRDGATTTVAAVPPADPAPRGVPATTPPTSTSSVPTPVSEALTVTAPPTAPPPSEPVGAGAHSTCEGSAPRVDGNKLVFTELATQRSTTVEIGTPNPGVHTMVWSPDSSKVAATLVAGEPNVLVVAADGSTVMAPGDAFAGVRDVAWTPSGSGLYHSRAADEPGDAGLDIYDLSSGRVTPVWETRLHLNGWLVDTRRGTVVVDDAGTITVMDADGGRAREFSEETTLPLRADFSRDGKRLAFAVGDAAGWLDLATMRFERAIAGSMSEFREFSPDGRYFAAVMARNGDHHVVIVDRNGTEVATYPHTYWGGWNAAGSVLAITDFRDDHLSPENVQISRVDLGTGGRHEVVRRAGIAGWSPTGDDVIAQFDVGGGVYRWCRSDSSFERWIPMLEVAAPTRPGAVAWSPDGRRVVFHTGTS